MKELVHSDHSILILKAILTTKKDSTVQTYYQVITMVVPTYHILLHLPQVIHLELIFQKPKIT